MASFSTKQKNLLTLSFVMAELVDCHFYWQLVYNLHYGIFQKYDLFWAPIHKFMNDI